MSHSPPPTSIFNETLEDIKSNQMIRHCTGTPSCMAALWYLAGPYQAGNFFNSTPANVVDNYVHDSFLTLISWVEGGHAPSYMVTTNFEDNADPTTLLHNRKICP